jgi:hypothetical protein
VLEFFNLGGNFFSFSKGNWEETHLDEDVTEKFSGLFGDGVRSK